MYFNPSARARVTWGLFADRRWGGRRCIGTSWAGSEYQRAVTDQLLADCDSRVVLWERLLYAAQRSFADMQLTVRSGRIAAVLPTPTFQTSPDCPASVIHRRCSISTHRPDAAGLGSGGAFSNAECRRSHESRRWRHGASRVAESPIGRFDRHR